MKSDLEIFRAMVAIDYMLLNIPQSDPAFDRLVYFQSGLLWAIDKAVDDDAEAIAEYIETYRRRN